MRLVVRFFLFKKGPSCRGTERKRHPQQPNTNGRTSYSCLPAPFSDDTGRTSGPYQVSETKMVSSFLSVSASHRGAKEPFPIVMITINYYIKPPGRGEQCYRCPLARITFRCSFSRSSWYAQRLASHFLSSSTRSSSAARMAVFLSL